MAKPKYVTFTGVKAEDIPAKLAEKFPPGAYKGVPGGADLTDINTGYMIERVTSVFGPKGLGWNLLYQPDDLVTGGESGRTVTRLAAMFLYSLWAEDGAKVDCAFPVSGVNQNDFKYADEGARTSAVGAAIKWLCFQNDVYKGEWNHHDAADEKKAASQPAKQAAPAGKPDDNEVAAANWDGVTRYTALYEKAKALGLPVEGVLEPGKTTKGQVRAMYAELDAKVKKAG